MVEVISGVKNWASILDENTRLQAEMLSRSEVICGHVALMPDAHLGMGATVGSVIPTKNAVIPAAIGVDIGCGMIAVNSGLTRDDLPEDLAGLHADVARSVPAGVGRGGAWSPSNRAYGQIRTRYADWLRENPSSARLEEIRDRSGSLTARARLQVGTLGSGNHFVEMGLDGAAALWVVIHSGSRGV
ncbi:MAG: RtcB family protein, partial [Lysobacterales bacterium]